MIRLSRNKLLHQIQIKPRFAYGIKSKTLDLNQSELPHESETMASKIEASSTNMIRFFETHQWIQTFSEITFLHKHPHQIQPLEPWVRAWIINQKAWSSDLRVLGFSQTVDMRNGLDWSWVHNDSMEESMIGLEKSHREELVCLSEEFWRVKNE